MKCVQRRRERHSRRLPVNLNNIRILRQVQSACTRFDKLSSFELLLLIVMFPHEGRHWNSIFISFEDGNENAIYLISFSLPDCLKASIGGKHKLYIHSWVSHSNPKNLYTLVSHFITLLPRLGWMNMSHVVQVCKLLHRNYLKLKCQWSAESWRVDKNCYVAFAIWGFHHWQLLWEIEKNSLFTHQRGSLLDPVTNGNTQFNL